MGPPVGKRQRIDDAAAREGEPRLALQEGNVLGPTEAQRMTCANRQAARQQARHVAYRDRPEGNTPARRLDLHHGLQPEQAARPGAHDLDFDALPLGLCAQGDRDLVGTHGAGSGIARHEEARRHRATSRAISSIDPSFSRAIGSPSSIAEGAEAQRPRQ
jgi:hypothetical protein